MKRFYKRPEITEAKWARFAKSYRREMNEPSRQRILEVLSHLSHDADFAVGCYCENFERCHRAILKELLLEHGARISEEEDNRRER